MDSFTWGPQFLTGIEEVDAQHHSLVKMINRFGDALATDVVDERFILTILEELSSYAQSHFQTEEQLMPAMRLDPRHIKAHQTEHRNFMTNVSGLMRTSSRDSLENHRSLFEYLVHWLAYHILGIDQNMARQAEAERDRRAVWIHSRTAMMTDGPVCAISCLSTSTFSSCWFGKGVMMRM